MKLTTVLLKIIDIQRMYQLYLLLPREKQILQKTNLGQPGLSQFQFQSVLGTHMQMAFCIRPYSTIRRPSSNIRVLNAHCRKFFDFTFLENTIFKYQVFSKCLLWKAWFASPCYAKGYQIFALAVEQKWLCCYSCLSALADSFCIFAFLGLSPLPR